MIELHKNAPSRELLVVFPIELILYSIASRREIPSFFTEGRGKGELSRGKPRHITQVPGKIGLQVYFTIKLFRDDASSHDDLSRMSLFISVMQK